MTKEERAARAVKGASIMAAKREANASAWRTSDERNANVRHTREQEELKAARTAATPIGDDDAVNGSASLAQMRAIMADASMALFRRLDAAECVLVYELGAGAGVGLDPADIAASSFRFLKAVADDENVPESLRFRALKSVLAIENTRKTAFQGSLQYAAKKELQLRLINSARIDAMKRAGRWPPAPGAEWALGSGDEVGWLPGWPGDWAWPAQSIHAAIDRRDNIDVLRDRLLARRATNRADDFDRILSGE
jgi:hypothetical protein